MVVEHQVVTNYMVVLAAAEEVTATILAAAAAAGTPVERVVQITTGLHGAEEEEDPITMDQTRPILLEQDQVTDR